MELRNVTNHRKAGEDFTSRAVWHIGGYDADHNDGWGSAGKVESRSTTDTVYGDPVNEVGTLVSNPCAYVSGKETEVGRWNGRKPQPADSVGDFQEHSLGGEWERIGGKWKVGAVEEHRRGIAVEVEKDRPLVMSHNHGFAGVFYPNRLLPEMGMVDHVRRSGDTGYVVVLAVRDEKTSAGASWGRNANDVRLNELDGV